MEELLSRFNSYLSENADSLSVLRASVNRFYGVNEELSKPKCDDKLDVKPSQLQRLSICLDQLYGQIEKINFINSTLVKAV